MDMVLVCFDVQVTAATLFRRFFKRQLLQDLMDFVHDCHLGDSLVLCTDPLCCLAVAGFCSILQDPGLRTFREMFIRRQLHHLIQEKVIGPVRLIQYLGALIVNISCAGYQTSGDFPLDVVQVLPVRGFHDK